MTRYPQPSLPLSQPLPPPGKMSCTHCGGSGFMNSPAPAPPALTPVAPMVARSSDPVSSHLRMYDIGKDGSRHRLVLLTAFRLLSRHGAIAADDITDSINHDREKNGLWPLARNNIQRVLLNLERMGWITRNDFLIHRFGREVVCYRWTGHGHENLIAKVMHDA